MRPTLRQCFRFAAIIRICGALAVILLALSGHAAWSQTAKAVKLVVPFPPGGGADILARLLAEQIGRTRGATVVVENRPGAGTVIATETVSRAAPDGGTVLLVANSFVINPNLKKLTYDPLTSFEPICFLTRSPNVLVVNNSSAYRTPADLFGAARAKPGELTMASVGPATTQHIAIAVLKRVANVNMIYVSFPGDAPAVGALLGDHVASAVVTYPAAAEQLKAGKLRALATASRSRIEPLPDVPTIAESGYPDYEADTWYGIVAPAKTPAATISQLALWFSSALQATETKPKLIAQGHFPVAACGADFATHLRKQYDDYGRAIREANIRGE
jgi:tripartite-type tricarboxylate transporter receptor subunit TctC